MSTNIDAYDLRRALPNKLLNQDGSITDFQGNIILPANESRAESYQLSKAIANKFLDENDDIKTYAEISLNLFIVVDELPPTGEKNKIYLVPSSNGMFDEYYWNKNEKWDKMGEISIDMSNYPTFDQMNTAIDNAVYNVLGGEY